MKVTVEQIMSWRPCPGYPETRVRDLVGEGLTPRQIMKLEISPKDKVWVCSRPDVMGVGLYAALANIVERVLTCERNSGQEPDSRSWAVVPLLRRIASGEDVPRVELDAAVDDARDAWTESPARVTAWAAWSAWSAAEAAKAGKSGKSGKAAGAARASVGAARTAAAVASKAVAGFVCEATEAAGDEWLYVIDHVLAYGTEPETPSDLTYADLGVNAIQKATTGVR